uniref:Uncharacterized protein n=1 Tax=Stomoxys calcitrans TaxID=35570 RepID=A0A1I8PVG5_STOCA
MPNYLSKNSFLMVEPLKVKFTNIQCEELDKSFVSFKNCSLKARARDTISFHLHAAMLKLPLTDIKINAQLFVKGNGYRPFMYNNSLDFCQFIKKPNRYMFWKIIYGLVKPFSNVNHTCPYNHDIIIDNMILKIEMFDLIPFPTNDYMMQFQFAFHDAYKIKVRQFSGENNLPPKELLLVDNCTVHKPIEMLKSGDGNIASTT